MESENRGAMADRNASTLAHWMPTWVKNAMENHPQLAKEAKRADHNLKWGAGTFDNISVSSLPKRPLTPAIICGSGPSLDDVLPYLKDWPGVIFCGASNLKTVAASCRDPDYVVSLDSNKDTEPQMVIPGKEWPNTTLICHPSIEPAIIRHWRWKKKMFRPLQMKNPFFEDIYPLMYPFIEVSFLNAGCTINTEMEVANYLGCWPVVIAGVDFGWVDGRGRCSRYEWENGEWVKKPDGPITSQYAPRISSDGHCVTTEEMVAYKQNFFLVAKTDDTQIYSCSRGIIRPDETLGYVRPEELIEFGKHPPAYANPDDVEKSHLKVLESMGITMEDDGSGALRVVHKGKSKTGPTKGTMSFIQKGASFNATLKAKDHVKDQTKYQIGEVDGVKKVEKKA